MMAMHRLRYRVFNGRLGWEVTTSADMEIDHYDVSNPVYFALLNAHAQLLACSRLLPTTGPNMLADTFPMLLGNAPAPRSPTLYESSRFCVDKDAAEATITGGLRLATPALLAGMCEWSLAMGLTGIVTVTDLIVERILAKAGWPIARIGQPLKIGKATAVAGIGEVSDATLAMLRRTGGFERPMIRPADAEAAA